MKMVEAVAEDVTVLEAYGPLGRHHRQGIR